MPLSIRSQLLIPRLLAIGVPTPSDYDLHRIIILGLVTYLSIAHSILLPVYLLISSHQLLQVVAGPLDMFIPLWWRILSRSRDSA